MAGEWEKVLLGKVVTLQRGFDLPAHNRRPGKVPIVSSSGISDYHAEVGAKGPGVVTGRYGTIGQVFLIKEDFWPLNTTLWVRDFHGNDPKFIAYLLRTIDFESCSDKSSVPGVNRNDLHRIPVLRPPLGEQRAIAAVLGALDDKIELNRRMNATLESMARALFQSWFVDFDPVRAKLDGREPVGMDAATAALFPDSIQDSPDGNIPTSWRSGHVGDVVEVFDSKRVPLSGREREQRNGPYPYHGAASVMDYVNDYLFDGIYALMGEDGSVINDDGTPVMQYVWGKFWVNNHAHVLRGKYGVCTEHLLLHLKVSNIGAFVTGAVQPKLNQGNMNRIPFILPSREVCEAFAKTIEPLFAHIRANADQSRTLATLRDTLLPKLLSGELSVAGAAEQQNQVLPLEQG